MRSVFKGSVVAIVTPFNHDGSIDFDSLKQLVEWHIESGTSGILPCGTTGESPTLSHDEHDLVVESVIKFVNKRRCRRGRRVSYHTLLQQTYSGRFKSAFY